MSDYIHHVPGRLRLKTAGLRRPECQAQLNKVLEELPGIISHNYNARIGSVVIHYQTSQISADDLLYHLKKAGCLSSLIASSATASMAGGALIQRVGALFGNALFGALLRKSVEASVLSLARGSRCI